MAWNPIKAWPLVASLVYFTSLKGADDQRSAVVALEEKKENSGLAFAAFQASAEKRCPVQCCVPCVDEPKRYNSPATYGDNIWLTADFLYWSAKEENLEYGIKADPIDLANPPVRPPAYGTFLTNTRLKKVDTEPQAGFRIGVGYHIPRDSWDLQLNWTRFHHDWTSHTKAFTTDNPNIINVADTEMYDPANNVIFNVESNGAKAKWDLHYDVLDFTLAKPVWSGKFLSLSPVLGLRSAWVNQKLNITYGTLPPTVPAFGPQPSFAFMTVREKNDFWAFGPKAGLNSTWVMKGDWSIYGNLAGSLLWSSVHISNRQHFPDPFVPSPTIDHATDVLKISEGYHALRATVEAVIGFKWDHFFCENRYHIGLSLGWENQMWFNVNVFDKERVNNIFANFHLMNGNLVFSGLTANVVFDF